MSLPPWTALVGLGLIYWAVRLRVSRVKQARKQLAERHRQRAVWLKMHDSL